MSWQVPLTDLSISEPDIEAVLDCLRSGWLTMGPRTEEFERAFAAYVGAPHAVAVSSGSAALQLALLAAGIGPGDEVLIPALTFVATAEAVLQVGAEPVLCDIAGAPDLNVDVEDLKARLTPRTRAIVLVHFMGYVGPWGPLRQLCDEHDLVLIEDAAQAIGAWAIPADPDAGVAGQRVGTVGELGCFSLFSKGQLCVGEGGMVVSADEALAARVRSLRSHAMTSGTWDRHRGHAESYDVTEVGFNFRLDESRAALGLSRLGRVDDDIEHRRALARRYREHLRDVPGIALTWSEEAVQTGSHFAFAVLSPDREQRDRLRVGLAQAGIQTTFYPALSNFSGYHAYGHHERAGQASACHSALPLHAGLSAEDQDAVIAAVCEAAAG
ncbi:MAG TPA: DegT/DnrJ/EryC1/StrS family aminotransferase [Solirubrobacteraceae bacterium]|jgi:dTDP-4-amino-4,6-dideoxygalactose transaminase|nr:DegT/DnrJ/EryC1/StrS family aminotransferase [Solirubrobacteraceae bacterium]